MRRGVDWTVMVAAIVIVAIGSYEVVRRSAHIAGEMIITRKNSGRITKDALA